MSYYIENINVLISSKKKQSLYLHAGSILCVVLSSGFALLSEEHAHWFMIPVTLCALLLMPDVAKWLTGIYDLFDPLGIIAVLGVLFFYLNPILHVYWDTWMLYVQPPPDWRPWLGYMGVLNVLGLIIYRLIISRAVGKHVRLKTYWKIDNSKSYLIITVALAVTLSAQIYVYAIFGGIKGIVSAYDGRSGAFEGMGWLFMISESFSILLAILFALLATRFRLLRSWKAIAFAFSIFLITAFLFGGLRGSRSNVVWQCFWFAGIVHLWIRPINKKIIAVALVLLFCFMFIYGAYKSYGMKAFELTKDIGQLQEMAETSGRTPERTLLGDLGRSDVQAYVLYLLSDDSGTYRYKLGSTYISGLTLLLPGPIRPEIYGKSEAGFELLKGVPSLGERATRIYGLAGEAMLNFGPVAIPFVFALFAWVVSICRAFMMRTEMGDSRILLYPFIINASFLILISDFGNLVFFILKIAVIPYLIIRFYSHKNLLKRDVA